MIVSSFFQKKKKKYAKAEDFWFWGHWCLERVGIKKNNEVLFVAKLKCLSCWCFKTFKSSMTKPTSCIISLYRTLRRRRNLQFWRSFNWIWNHHPIRYHFFWNGAKALWRNYLWDEFREWNWRKNSFKGHMGYIVNEMTWSDSIQYRWDKMLWDIRAKQIIRN